MGSENKIKYRDFVAGAFKKEKHKAGEHPILIFLRKNQAHAYNVAYITKAVRMNENSVRSMLRKLTKKGLIIHKTPFFAFKR